MFVARGDGERGQRGTRRTVFTYSGRGNLNGNESRGGGFGDVEGDEQSWRGGGGEDGEVEDGMTEVESFDGGDGGDVVEGEGEESGGTVG